MNKIEKNLTQDRIENLKTCIKFELEKNNPCKIYLDEKINNLIRLKSYLNSEVK